LTVTLVETRPEPSDEESERRRLGDILVERGVITSAALRKVLAE